MREGVREGEKEGQKRDSYKSVSIYIVSVWRENLHARRNNIRNNTWSTATNMIILVPLI